MLLLNLQYIGSKTKFTPLAMFHCHLIQLNLFTFVYKKRTHIFLPEANITLITTFALTSGRTFFRFIYYV